MVPLELTLNQQEGDSMAILLKERFPIPREGYDREQFNQLIRALELAFRKVDFELVDDADQRVAEDWLLR